MKNYQVIVIGAGAAGLMCAGTAASLGAKVLLLEKNGIAGKKLRITGKGRCNITNNKPLEEFLTHIGPDYRFLYSAFSKFFSEDLLSFLESIGIEIALERGGRYFPKSNDAVYFTQKILSWCEKAGTTIQYNSEVTDLIIENNKVIGVTLLNGSKIFANKTVIATGGLSYPKTGSTGDGYSLAKQAGHTIHRPIPLLVPFTSDDRNLKMLVGLKLKNINARILQNDKVLYEEFGELDFYENTIEGPVILTLSRKLMPGLLSGNNYKLSIDLKPALNIKMLDHRLINELNNLGKLPVIKAIETLLPRQMVQYFLDLCGIPETKLCGQISSESRKIILNNLKNLNFKITGHAGFNRAIITGGGVCLKEIKPNTLESKKTEGLFFAGEIMDIDADTGGYNLQIAFSTGYLAGDILGKTNV